ncbi:hypothetical protein QAD02_015099 [Eretmocerus hayati]|uniref:Uncharacterized protein n=1 Tax=Eretmocerus hayati TaxID=131215 RepID=A0ACC2P7Q2_9HYME|nr:hypothetical protein QAD02_015099 [Eretmocerus hayati]
MTTTELFAIALLLSKMLTAFSVNDDDDDEKASRGKVSKFCIDADRHPVVPKVDYLLCSAKLNDSVLFECRFCGDPAGERQGRIWYRQDGEQLKKPREVELDMDNDPNLSRVRLTPDSSLLVRNLRLEDAALYSCRAAEGQHVDHNFSYRLELVLESSEKEETGNMKAWKKYQKSKLSPVTLLLAAEDNEELANIREEGVQLEVISEWGRWGPCGECIKFGRGNKTRRAYCRIRSRILKEVNEDENVMPATMEFFALSPLIPCRSRTLSERFPEVSNLTKSIPDFILVEKCKPCKKKKRNRKKKFKYKKRYLLNEGANFSLDCPGANAESDIVWEKDSKVLVKGKGYSFRKKDPTSRVLVDTHFTVYFKDVSVSVVKSRKCVSCRSRGELGSCKDPFMLNSTQIANEKGVVAEDCASGWCMKIIESKNLNNEYGIATERACLQRGPDDSEERCDFATRRNKRVFMCYCRGDMCNTSTRMSSSLSSYLLPLIIAIVPSVMTIFTRKET